MRADLGFIATMALLGVVTLLTRCFFFLSRRELAMPAWVQRGLRYAPLAALAAVVAPEVVLTQGEWSLHFRDARLWAVVAATLWYAVRRGVLGTIVVGMATLLALKLGLGWP